MTAIESPAALLLTSTRVSFARRSGYSLLAEYMPCRKLSVLRSEPRSLPARAATRILSRASLTNWYRISSGRLELRAAYELLKSDYGIVHFLWADSDLGFMDVLRLRRSSFKLCGTFHACGEDLPSIIAGTHRLQRLDAFILMSSLQADFFLKCGVPAEKLHVILHGVDTDAWRPGSQRAHAKFRVLSVGGYRRNFSRFRDLSRALADRPEIEIRVVAPRGCGEELQSLGNLTILSGISDADLLDEYQQASCLVLAVSNATANNALLEALSCGLPVISEDIGGISEYITRDCALITKPGDVDDMRTAITRLFRSRLAVKEMSAAARERAEQLKWSNTAVQTLQLYRELVSS